jgi:hypothetical protein
LKDNISNDLIKKYIETLKIDFAKYINFDNYDKNNIQQLHHDLLIKLNEQANDFIGLSCVIKEKDLKESESINNNIIYYHYDDKVVKKILKSSKKNKKGHNRKSNKNENNENKQEIKTKNNSKSNRNKRFVYGKHKNNTNNKHEDN